MTKDEDVRLRAYESGDLEAMVALDATCFAPSFRFGIESMQHFAEAKNAWSRIAVVGIEIVGFCIVHLERVPGGTIGYLVTIDVAKEHRRRGLGERMLAEAESWLRNSGAAVMLLHVYVRNAGAIRFYERAGYQRDGERRGFYGPRMDAAMFWKRLDS